MTYSGRRPAAGETELKTYQALFIFLASLTEERVAAVLEAIRGEIAKLKGDVVKVLPVEKRMFARRLAKQDAGLYTKLFFRIEPAGIAPLQARFRLMDDIFRVQIVSIGAEDMRKIEGPPKPAERPEPPAAPQGEPTRG